MKISQSGTTSTSKQDPCWWKNQIVHPRKSNLKDLFNILNLWSIQYSYIDQLKNFQFLCKYFFLLQDWPNDHVNKLTKELLQVQILNGESNDK